MLWDLGMNVGDMEKNEELIQVIKNLEKDFDLVLIAERFDESLVVLKEEFCWSLEDIQYMNVSKRTPP